MDCLQTSPLAFTPEAENGACQGAESSATLLVQLAEAFEDWENGFRADPSRFMTAEQCADAKVSELSASRAAYLLSLLQARRCAQARKVTWHDWGAGCDRSFCEACKCYVNP